MCKPLTLVLRGNKNEWARLSVEAYKGSNGEKEQHTFSLHSQCLNGILNIPVILCLLTMRSVYL